MLNYSAMSADDASPPALDVSWLLFIIQQAQGLLGFSVTLIHFSSSVIFCQRTTLPGSFMTQHIESRDFGSLSRFLSDRWKFHGGCIESLFFLEYDYRTGGKVKERKFLLSLLYRGVNIQTVSGFEANFPADFELCLTQIFYWLANHKKVGLRLIFFFHSSCEILSWLRYYLEGEWPFFIIIISFYPGDSYSLAVWDKEIRFQEREGIPASADVW